MEYRNLGNTNLTVSAICLGTMTWGKQNTESEGHEQMDMALDFGVNFFDTAEVYAVPPGPDTFGKTETYIGNWFANRKNRDKVILATKVAGPGMPWVRNGKNILNRTNITEAVEGSLKRLQTDYIDLYQLHWPNRPNYHFGRYFNYNSYNLDPGAIRADMIETLETLDDLVKAGKIRHIGLSNESAWGLMSYTQLAKEKKLPRVVSIQNEYSLLCRTLEPDLAEASVYEQVGLLAWSPLAGGMLSGKYLDGNRPEGSRWSLDDRMKHRDTPHANEAVKDYIQIAHKYDLNPVQMALSFVTHRPFVTSNIIGATNLYQLKMNLESINVALSPEVLDEISVVRKKYPVPY